MKKRIWFGVICILLGLSFCLLPAAAAPWPGAAPAYGPDNLIRFHVIANSDSEEDQLLKYAVRDEILKKFSPLAARSSSLEESREMLLTMTGEFQQTAGRVVREWGRDYPVSVEYGVYPFPAKAYGDIVLPGGDYEAVKIKIGEARGANWWCILFPPVCFVNAKESTVVPVDGKAAVPLDSAKKKKGLSYRGKKIGFFFERFLP